MNNTGTTIRHQKRTKIAECHTSFFLTHVQSLVNFSVQTLAVNGVQVKQRVQELA